jgi:hypothetical protein
MVGAALVQHIVVLAVSLLMVPVRLAPTRHLAVLQSPLMEPVEVRTAVRARADSAVHNTVTVVPSPLSVRLVVKASLEHAHKLGKVQHVYNYIY